MKTRIVIILNFIVVVAIAITITFYNRATEEKLTQNAYDSIVSLADGMQKTGTSYMKGEQEIVDSWARYINSNSMTMEEAVEYVRTSQDTSTESAHILWADTYNGLSTVAKASDPTDYSVEYKMQSFSGWYSKDLSEYIDDLDFENDSILMTTAYTNIMDGERSVAFCRELTLNYEGEARMAYLLRVIPENTLKEKWVFTTDLADAEIAFTEADGNYIIKSTGLKGNNFFEFLYSYNKIDIEAVQEEIYDKGNSYYEALNSRGVETVYAYSVIEEGAEWLVIVSIPRASLVDSGHDYHSIVWLLLVTLSVLLISDITFFYLSNVRERKDSRTILAQQEKLAKALERSEAANRSKTMFLNNMSHDIRTPMNAIMGFSKLAEDELENTDKVREYLGKIQMSAEHLTELINDILDMSRIESGKVVVEEHCESIRSLIEEIGTITRMDMEQKHLTYRVDLSELAQDYVYADRLRLKRALINIVSNAMKYTEEGGSIDLRVASYQVEEAGYTGVRFTVSDTGIGMTPEFLQHIFEPFERERTSTVSGIQGTGLGMAITKNLVEIMGGTIEAQSTKGVGSTFTVNLTFRIGAESQVEEEQETQEAPVDILQGKRVLLAEDNVFNQEIARALLLQSGLTVDIVADGSEAVARMKQADRPHYDFILMDVQMPTMDGYEATRRIRDLGQEELKQIPIIAVTANAFEEDRQKAVAAGMDDHIAKPINIQILQKTLARLLREKCR